MKSKKEYLMKVFSEEGADIEKSKLSAIFSLNESGLDFLLVLIGVVRDEMDRLLSEVDASNEFEQDLYSLYQRFCIDVGDNQEFQIDKMLSEYITKLKNESLTEKYSIIFEKLANLRQERIRYWENISERVGKNLEVYSVKFKELLAKYY